jgi:poly-gamma-glutamate capsule biosynthesis protein CapA/YwtB (metallophosphatase superfamily)
MGNPVRYCLMVFVLSMMLFVTPDMGSVQAEESGDETIRVAAMGDIMMGTDNMLPTDGGAGLFAEVTPFLKDADVVFGNLEGTLSNQGRTHKTKYAFRTPPEYGRHLEAAGFNMMSIANNHINDFGDIAKQQTIETLERHGIAWSGPPGTVARKTVNGLKVAMIAFHASPTSNYLLDIPGAERMVAKEAATNDIVIVSFHGGAEGQDHIHTPRAMERYLGEQRGEVVRFSRAVIDAGADLVIGHGPHVPRAVEIYRDRLIAYSLGNFCTERGINVKGYTGYAPLLLVDLKPDGRVSGGRVVSFLQTFAQPPKLDGEERAAKLMYELGVADFPDSNAVGPTGDLVVPQSRK